LYVSIVADETDKLNLLKMKLHYSAADVISDKTQYCEM